MKHAQTVHNGPFRKERLVEQQNPAIRISGLHKSYQHLHMLKGVELEVARGSVFALLGSNGAGKTTLVRILATLLKPDDGTASVNGFDVVTQPAQVRESISLTGQFADLWTAVAWCAGILVIAYAIAMITYRKKIA